jgi:plasmid stabilization system protein ParE
MRVVVHPALASDIDSILDWLSSERPAAIEPLQRHIDEAVARISVWPKLAPIVVDLGNDVRALMLARYPYRLFYRVRPEAIEILHLRHTSRAPWEGGR